MKCQKCAVCGELIKAKENGTKLCLPVIVGTASGESRHCWCVCDGCKGDFVKRSARAIKELKESV